MKKELVIEMEEECITCPMLSLETDNIYFFDDVVYKDHHCEHINFCKKVRNNWEKYQERKVTP